MIRAFWACFALSMALYATMSLWTLPQITAQAGGLRPFDLRPLGYTEADARAFLHAISNKGRALYTGPQHLLDLFYPITLAAVFVLGAMILYRRRVLWAMIGLALIGEVSDYGENALVSAMLSSHPDTVSAGTIALAGFLTFVKSMAVTACFCGLIYGAVRVQLAKRRLQRGLKRFGYMSLEPKDAEYDIPDPVETHHAPAPFKSRRTQTPRGLNLEAGE